MASDRGRFPVCHIAGSSEFSDVILINSRSLQLYTYYTYTYTYIHVYVCVCLLCHWEFSYRCPLPPRCSIFPAFFSLYSEKINTDEQRIHIHMYVYVTIVYDVSECMCVCVVRMQAPTKTEQKTLANARLDSRQDKVENEVRLDRGNTNETTKG